MFRFEGLWRHRDFRRLWAGQTVSVFGSLTTRIALPFTAVVYLDARPIEIALVTACDVLAGIVFGLAAGVWVDRLRRRPIMIAADIGRALIIGSVPLAAFFGTLHIEQLYAVAFLAGILTTFFDVAYQSYLPSLIEQEQLVEGNSKLAASASVAEFGAFGAAGWLVQLATAPGAMLVDAVSFLASAASIVTIRQPEQTPRAAESRQSALTEAIDGARALMGDRILRYLAASWVMLSLASGMLGSVFLLFTSRELGFSPGVLGLIFAVGGVTSFVGAVSADWCRRRFGAGGAMIVGLMFGGCGVLLMAGARDASILAAALLIGQQLISDPGWTVYEINQVSLRQAVAPEKMLGRINAGVRFAGLVAMLGGTLVAGGIAGAVGARPVLLLAACAAFGGALVLMFSPVRRLRGETIIVDADRPLSAPTAVS
jgi:MFS family permease